jgi:hypothetical protein
MRKLRHNKAPQRKGVLVELDYMAADYGNFGGGTVQVPIVYVEGAPDRQQIAYVDEWLRALTRPGLAEQIERATDALARARKLLDEPIDGRL